MRYSEHYETKAAAEFVVNKCLKLLIEKKLLLEIKAQRLATVTDSQSLHR